MTKLEEFCETNKSGSCSWFEPDGRVDEAKWWLRAFVKLVRERANDGHLKCSTWGRIGMSFDEVVRELELEEK